MKVFGLFDEPTTKPFPVKNGFVFSLRGGDICHPIGSGDWFHPPYFTRVWRTSCRIPLLPYFAYRFGKRGGYIGFKCYGADRDAYKNWMQPSDVYSGSRALQLSARPFATLTEQDLA